MISPKSSVHSHESIDLGHSLESVIERGADKSAKNRHCEARSNLTTMGGQKSINIVLILSDRCKIASFLAMTSVFMSDNGRG